MATLPIEAEYAAQLFAQQAGKQVSRDYLQQTVPENKSILVVAMVVDEGTEDTVLAAASGHPNVSLGLEVGRRRTPNWTPVDQEWEARITFIGGHRVIPE